MRALVFSLDGYLLVFLRRRQLMFFFPEIPYMPGDTWNLSFDWCPNPFFGISIRRRPDHYMGAGPWRRHTSLYASIMKNC